MAASGLPGKVIVSTYLPTSAKRSKCEPRRPLRRPDHRSHFGSRYTSGCCDLASLFEILRVFHNFIWLRGPVLYPFFPLLPPSFPARNANTTDDTTGTEPRTKRRQGLTDDTIWRKEDRRPRETPNHSPEQQTTRQAAGRQTGRTAPAYDREGKRQTTHQGKETTDGQERADRRRRAAARYERERADRRSPAAARHDQERDGRQPDEARSL